jgi:hypothetical protein
MEPMQQRRGRGYRGGQGHASRTAGDGLWPVANNDPTRHIRAGSVASIGGTPDYFCASAALTLISSTSKMSSELGAMPWLPRSP